MIIDDTQLRVTQKKAATIAIGLMSLPIVLGVLAVLFLKDAFSDTVFSFYGTLQLVLIIITGIEIVLMIVLRNKIIWGAGQVEDSNKESDFIQRLFNAFIVNFALCISIAVYGLLLYIMGKDQSILYGFLGASLFLMFVQFPKYEEWETRLKNFLED
jgi:hypothetical protein